MNKEIKEYLLENAKGCALNSLFGGFQYIFGDVYQHPEVKEMFLDFLVELIKNNELKLASQGEFLKGSAEEQVNVLRKAWPEDINPNIMEKDVGDLWWIVSAPAGAVWLYPDGTEIWT